MNVECLRDEVIRLLRDFNGLETIKRLSWEVLGYERLQEPFPDRLLPDALKGQVLDASLLAGNQGFFIVHVHCSKEALDPSLERMAVRKASKRFPFAAFIFTNRSHEQWDFLYPPGGCKPLGLFASGEGCLGARTGRLLARLAALDGDDRPLPLLELLGKYEDVFGKAGVHGQAGRKAGLSTLLSIYMNDLARCPLLCPREEAELIHTVNTCGPVLQAGRRRERRVPEQRLREFLNARDDLVLGNLRLGFYLAKTYRTCFLDLLDLIQEANLGLIRAAELVEESYGTRFNTYAYPWVRQTIGRAIANGERLIRVPIYLLSRASRSELARLIPCITPLDDSAIHRSRTLQDRSSAPDHGLLTLERSAEVRAALNRLSPRLREILDRRFGLDGNKPETLQQLGDRLGLTKERIRQLEAVALSEVRHHLTATAHFEDFKEQPRDCTPRRCVRRSPRLTGGSGSAAPEDGSSCANGSGIPLPAGVATAD